MHGRRPALLLPLLSLLLVPGCIGMLGSDDADDATGEGGSGELTGASFEASSPTPAQEQGERRNDSRGSTLLAPRPAAPSYAAGVKDGLLEVEVPVPVVLVGFGANATEALRKELDARPVRHALLSSEANFPPLGAARYGFPSFPLAPVPRYEVHALPDAAAASFFGRLAAEGELEKGLYDADLAERLLVDVLTREGLAPRAEAPTLVLLHAGQRLPEPHSYRVAYEAGVVGGARAFGEREPLLAFDLSAAPDAWVGQDAPYEKPMKDPAAAGVPKTLALLARHATEHRLLQAPLYPVSPQGCHGITILGVTRAGSLGPAPILPRAFDAIDASALKASFETLAGGEAVHVDLKLLRLPVDDPALHAVASTGNLDALRWYVTERWDDYWVAHEGCEAYLSVLIEGSVADGNMGIAQWDVDEDRRISFSIVDDEARICEMEAVDCGGASPGVFALPMYLVAHETGHLFGQRHPHDVTFHDGDGQRAPAFSSVHSVMSYQSADRTWSFGAIDANNWARNRVATLFQQADGASLDDAALKPVLDALSRQDWRAAAAALPRTPAEGAAA